MSDSFTPRVVASKQKQEMRAEAQPLPDKVSYSKLCRRLFFKAFTVPLGWFLHMAATGILMPSSSKHLTFVFLHLFVYILIINLF